VLEAFDKAEAAIGPVYDVGQIFEDPQYQARDSVTTIEDKDLGPLRMQNVFPRLSRTPGRIKHGGPRLGEHSAEVLDELTRAGRISPELAARVALRAKPRSKD
jgi:crotonobetainyl-CoA:carnitine CoA-transferase CaiB-like acyl-CoA transferase